MNKTRWYEAPLWAGMDLFAFLRLLVRNRLAVSPSRWPMAASITLFATCNTALRWVQNLRFGRRIARVEIPPEVVFIVGHWRTGTTMLHELLALDPGNRSPTTYESLSPNHFLISEPWVRRWLPFLLPRQRPMDNMRVSFDRPQEDEAALCNLGVPSPFLTVAFPNRPLQYPRYGDLEQLTPRELARWQRAMRRFLQQLLLKRPGRLVLKSPQHTFRLKVLGNMFPQARFIHLVRDPYVLFPSTVHFWKTMYQTYGLQRPNLRGLDDFVFDTLLAMHNKVEETRHLLDPARFYDLRYEDLVRDPVEAVRAIYARFQWPGFEAAEPAFRQYARRSQRYQTNRYEGLSPELRQQIAQRWQPYFTKYGYPI